jgi:hypothetical protein
LSPGVTILYKKTKCDIEFLGSKAKNFSMTEATAGGQVDIPFFGEIGAGTHMKFGFSVFAEKPVVEKHPTLVCDYENCGTKSTVPVTRTKLVIHIYRDYQGTLMLKPGGTLTVAITSHLKSLTLGTAWDTLCSCNRPWVQSRLVDVFASLTQSSNVGRH